MRNAESTIGNAMDSVLQQREVALEVIVVDDGSTDESVARVRALNDSRITVLQREAEGIAPALEAARHQASAPLLARMDADDICLPGRFAAQRDSIGESAVLATEVELFGEVDEGMRRYVQWQNRLHTAVEHRQAMFIEAPVCHPSTLLRADAVAEVGGYRNGDFPEDYDLWLRLNAAGHSFRKLNRAFLRWRMWPGQATRLDQRYRWAAFVALKAEHVAHELQRDHRPTWIWGAGLNGRRFMREAERFGLRANRWIDIDPKKIGRERRGTPIVTPNSLGPPDTQRVLVAVRSWGARQEIREYLQARGFVEGRDFWCVA